MNTIGQNIKSIRTTLNYTQAEFAAKIGMKKSIITHYEKGTRGVSEAVRKLICTVYNVEEEYLLHGKGNMFKDVSNVEAGLTEYYLDEDDRIFVQEYLRLEKRQREAIHLFINNIMTCKQKK